MKNRGILFLLLALTAAACSKPADRFEFIYTPKSWQDSSAFNFDITLDEPETSYSTRIACRYNMSTINSACIPVLISVTSPSGEIFMESVDLPLAQCDSMIRTRKSGGPVMDIDWPYRDRIIPAADTGIWHVAIRPVRKAMVQSIYGIGFSYKRN